MKYYLCDPIQLDLGEGPDVPEGTAFSGAARGTDGRFVIVTPEPLPASPSRVELTTAQELSQACAERGITPAGPLLYGTPLDPAAARVRARELSALGLNNLTVEEQDELTRCLSRIL